MLQALLRAFPDAPNIVYKCVNEQKAANFFPAFFLLIKMQAKDEDDAVSV